MAVLSHSLANGGFGEAISELEDEVLPKLWGLAAKQGETFDFFVDGPSVTAFALEYKTAVNAGDFAGAQASVIDYKEFAERAAIE